MLEKGALGLRYLIKYVLDNKKEDFLVVKNCLNETKMALIIILFTNNSDYFSDMIPEFVLKETFTMEPLKIKINGKNENVDYGIGYKTNSDLSYEEQFKHIRNALAHFEFQFKDNIIYINRNEYTAKFDIKWLIILIFRTISNERNNLFKGMKDYSLIATNLKKEDDYEEFKEKIRNGLISFYEIELLSGNKETFKRKINFVGLSTEEYTFNIIAEYIKRELLKLSLSSNLSSNVALGIINRNFRNIEKYLGGLVKLKICKIDINNPIFENPEFQNLPYTSKLQYLINMFKIKNPLIYNSVMFLNLLKLLDTLEKNEDLEKDDNKILLLELNNALELLLKAYANIVLASNLGNKEKSLIERYPIIARFVHGKKIYESYIKELTKYYQELEEHNGSPKDKRNILNLLKSYKEKLEDVKENRVHKDFFWNLRNAITHNHIEFDGDYIRFFITGQNIKYRKFSKKHNKWLEKEFSNQNPIWEMIISKDDFLDFIDSIYESLGVEVKVNISKYCKRSSYGK